MVQNKGMVNKSKNASRFGHYNLSIIPLANHAIFVGAELKETKFSYSLKMIFWFHENGWRQGLLFQVLLLLLLYHSGSNL